MRYLWLKLRMALAIFAMLILTLFMVRLFSGPEDAWIKNGQGEWVKHGHPAGPPPADDYQEPAIHGILPLVFLAGFVVPLFFVGSFKLRNRLTYDMSKRDVKILGYLSIALPLTGFLILTGLGLEIGMSEPDGDSNSSVATLLFIFSLAGFSLVCMVSGIIFYALKRNCSDHYYLEKSRRELLDELQNHVSSGN